MAKNKHILICLIEDIPFKIFNISVIGIDF